MATLPSTLGGLLEWSTPPWLLGTWGRRWVTSVGSVLDPFVTRAKEATKTRFVLLAPSDALPLIGVERAIERGLDEADARYRSRLHAAWLTWKWSGTVYGMLMSLDAHGLEAGPVGAFDPWGEWPTDWPVESHVWYTETTDWAPDDPPYGTSADWWRFWFLINAYAEAITTDLLWNSPGTWDDGGVWDLGTWDGAILTSQSVETWRQQIRKWKTAGTTCHSMYFITSSGGWADIWGPFGAWDGLDEGVWNGNVSEIPVGEWA